MDGYAPAGCWAIAPARRIVGVHLPSVSVERLEQVVIIASVVVETEDRQPVASCRRGNVLAAVSAPAATGEDVARSKHAFGAGVASSADRGASVERCDH